MKIKLYAQAGQADGLGHFSRMLALAELVGGEYNVELVIPDNEVTSTLKSEYVNLKRVSTKDFFHPSPNKDSIVVMDGYGFDTDVQDRFASAFSRTLAIGDYGPLTYKTDAYLNHAGSFEGLDNLLASTTKTYLGPEYALLRECFYKAIKNAPRLMPKEKAVFLSFGSMDEKSLGVKFVSWLNEIGFTGPIKALISKSSDSFKKLDPKICLTDLDSQRLLKEMTECTHFFTSSSNIAFEVAAVGGILHIGQTAENQRALHSSMVSREAAVDSKDWSQFTKESLQQALENSNWKSIVENQSKLFGSNPQTNIRNIFSDLGSNL